MLIGRALARWQSALTISVTAVLFLFVKEPFPWWQDWFWLVGGLIAESALVASTLSDPKVSTEVVAREFASRFDLTKIASSNSRRCLERALEYQRNMLTLATRHQGAMRAQLEQTVNDINNWIGHMYELALHIDSFESNELVERDRRNVPQQIEKARIRLKNETDEQLKADLQSQIALLERQLETLNATGNSVKRAQIQLDNTLSSVATIYAQMSQLGTKEVDSARAQRLQLEIKDEIASLQDTIHALDEVQSQRLRLE